MPGEYQYVWLLWSSAFLVPWALVYALAPAFRSRMLRVSIATSFLGLTEPIFVPEYWNPPSLFGFEFGMYWSGIHEHFSWRRGAGKRRFL
jgi:hypothetical protein